MQYEQREEATTVLHLQCSHCGHHLFTYRMDCQEPLLRCYLDRICGPQEVRDLQRNLGKSSTADFWFCPSCCSLIGEIQVYPKESRRALQLVKGSLHTPYLLVGEKKLTQSYRSRHKIKEVIENAD